MHLDAANWLSGTGATYYPQSKELIVGADATIFADPGSDAPKIIANGSSAHLTIAPTDGRAVHLGGLSLSNGATAVVESLGAARTELNYRVLLVQHPAGVSIDIDSQHGSTLDLADNAMIVDYTGSSNSPAVAIEDLVGVGYNEGDWGGFGIISSTAAADVEHLALATADNDPQSEWGLNVGFGSERDAGTFAGQNVDATSVLLRFGLRLDFDLDGVVSFEDFSMYSTYYGSTNSSWSHGDLNYDGATDFQDLSVFNIIYEVTPSPAAPGFVGASASGSQITLTWDAVPDATGYNVYRVAGSGPIPTQATPIAANLTTTEFVDPDRPVGTRFTYAVQAVSPAGAGDRSEYITTTTAPAAPGTVTATPVNDSQVDIDWRDVSGDGVTYDLYRGTSIPVPLDNTTLIASGLTESNFSDDTADASTSYYYVVVAVSPGGASSTGSAANEGEETQTPDPRPGATSGLYVSDVTSAEVTIAWSATAAAASYNIYRVQDAEEQSETPYATTTVTTFTDDELPLSSAFRYTVAAVNPGGEGPLSIAVSATTSGLQPGDSDAFFGNNGIDQIDSGTNDFVYGITSQPDGKLLAANVEGSSPNRSLSVFRYNPDGTLDPTYGIGGRALFPDRAYSTVRIAMQPDGRALLQGLFAHGSQPGYYELIGRLNPDGTRDLAFGNNGAVPLPPTLANRIVIPELAVMDDGRFVSLANDYYPANPPISHWVITRYQADGQFDQSFGTGGTVRLTDPNPAYGDGGKDIAVQHDGTIVIGGRSVYKDSDDVYQEDLVIAKLKPDGTLDSTFGSGGWYTDDGDGTWGGVRDLVVQDDGKIIFSPLGSSQSHDDFLVRLLPNGSPDSSFGAGGFVPWPGPSYWSTPRSLSMQPNGRIVVVGQRAGFAVHRFNSDGSPDSSFGIGGTRLLTVTPNSGIGEAPYDAVVQPNGDIAVAGFTPSAGRTSPNLSDGVVARFVGDGLDLVIDGMPEEVTRDWSSGEAEAPHETDPGAFIPLNDDFDEADPSDTDPQPDMETEEASPDDDELVHASLVFTGSHEHSGWMLDFPEEELRVYKQLRNAATGHLTLQEVHPNEPQAPPTSTVLNLRIERIALGDEAAISAFLMPPAATQSSPPPAGSKKPQDKAAVAIGVTKLDWVVWTPDADPASPPSVPPTAERPWVANPPLETAYAGAKNRVRMFPDKLAPFDHQNGVERDAFHADRNKVLLKAQLSVKKADIDVWFTVWDVDDPQSGVADPNDNDPNAEAPSKAGPDNRLTGNPNHFGDGPQVFHAKTDANGVAVVTLAVSKQPGNNYKAYAIVHQHGTQRTFESSQALADGRRKTPVPRGVGVTPELIVWRKLHLERDSMESPPATEDFTGQDAAPSVKDGRLIDVDADRMKPEYAKAFILVDETELNAKWNPRRAAKWYHHYDVNIGRKPGNDIRDVRSEDDFWVIQVVTAYDASELYDNDDRDAGPAILGEGLPGEVIPDNTVPGGFSIFDGPVFIYSETVRDVAGAPGNVPVEQLRWRTVFHETLHRFNMDHARPVDIVNNPGDQGPMWREFIFHRSDDRFMQLTDGQLDRVRSVARPK